MPEELGSDTLAPSRGVNVNTLELARELCAILEVPKGDELANADQRPLVIGTDHVTTSGPNFLESVAVST
jgi:hypothetical protein